MAFTVIPMNRPLFCVLVLFALSLPAAGQYKDPEETPSGAVVKQDKESTRDFYGRMVPFKTSLKGEIEAPKDAYPFLSTLAKWAQEAAK